MGKRGPKRTPTAILENRGSRKVEFRKNEPKPGPAMPICPPWIQGEARLTWERVVPELVSLGVMTKLDGFAFSRYCIYSVLWLKELNNPGRTEATLERYANQLQRLETSFGLTPSARASLDTNKTDTEKDELELLMRGRNIG